MEMKNDLVRTAAKGLRDTFTTPQPGEAEGTPDRDPRKNNHSNTRRFIVRVLWLAAFVAVWQAVVATHVVDNVIVASPYQTVIEGRKLLANGVLEGDIYWTLRRLVLGFLVASAGGIIMGYALATFRAVEDALDWTIQGLRSISPLALVPLTVLWFGLGEMQKVVLIAITIFFPVVLGVYHSVRGVPELLVRAGKTLGCTSDYQIFRRVVFPAALPGIFDGLRVGLGIGYLVIIAAEMIGADKGLGYLVFTAGQDFATAGMFVGIATIAVLGVLSDRVILLIKRLVVPWYQPRVAQ